MVRPVICAPLPPLPNASLVISAKPASEPITLDASSGITKLELVRYYEEDNANIHRGVHELSQRATRRYEAARASVRRFINAEHDHEIIFTRGATEAINLLAASWGSVNLQAGDEVVVTRADHESNIGAWLRLQSIGVVPRFPDAIGPQHHHAAGLDAFGFGKPS